MHIDITRQMSQSLYKLRIYINYEVDDFFFFFFFFYDKVHPSCAICMRNQLKPFGFRSKFSRKIVEFLYYIHIRVMYIQRNVTQFSCILCNTYFQPSIVPSCYEFISFREKKRTCLQTFTSDRHSQSEYDTWRSTITKNNCTLLDEARSSSIILEIDIMLRDVQRTVKMPGTRLKMRIKICIHQTRPIDNRGISQTNFL